MNSDWDHLKGDQRVVKTMKAIKENDGFPGPVPDYVRKYILEKALADVEVSPFSGLDMGWTLTADGKKFLKEVSRNERYAKKYKESGRAIRFRGAQASMRDAVVPLTIEVLDALKAIRETGDPQTDKMEILARIQRYGQHAAKTVKNALGQQVVVSGALAECNDGIWTLTKAGESVEAGHIRKSECAQFTGKVR